MRKLIFYWLLPLLVVDQALKFYVKLTYEVCHRYNHDQWIYCSDTLIPGILDLRFVENNGIAFGLYFGGVEIKYILSVFRILAAIAIGYYLHKLVKEKAHKGFQRSVAMIWAGAIGNVIDGSFYGLIFNKGLRYDSIGNQWIDYSGLAEVSSDGYTGVFLGSVVDMFQFTVNWPSWWPSWMPFGDAGEFVFSPIWNVADAAISLGVIWIIIRQGEYFYKKKNSSRKVDVGSTTIGGDSPVRIQSMTTTNTCDVEASIAQSISLIKAGSELVRLTAPSIKDAVALEAIVKGVRGAGYDTPIVADIHFTPNAAFRAADFVEKIRINPGNFADKKKFESHEYTDESYADELERIRKKFTPLVLKCKELGRAMRIGTNHGSLSDRITSRFGDTPLGMVESALEFIRICRENDYHSLVISMKSSNTKVMVEAYRMLVSRMEEEDMDYPLHLGVTEAGDGEDGRIKSAVGIGTLLEEGIGDTVRVSLTEAPEAELPVARSLVDRYVDHDGYRVMGDGDKRAKGEPVVVASIADRGEVVPANFLGAGYRYSVPEDKWNITDQAADLIYTGSRVVKFALPGTLRVLVDGSLWSEELEGHDAFWSIEEYKDLEEGIKGKGTHYLKVGVQDAAGLLEAGADRENVVVVLSSEEERPLTSLRKAIEVIEGGKWKMILNLDSSEAIDSYALFNSIDSGALLLDGKLDGVWFEGNNVSLVERNRLSFGVLQATRTRISKTEYISCPSCGRTLFDLEETTAKIRKVTNHLKGVKIGIMGCIVNGPGEMADADFGYVGTGPGKITLYREKEVVRKNVPEDEAVEALIDLIKSEGSWVDP